MRRLFSSASGRSRNIPEVFEGSSLSEMLREQSLSPFPPPEKKHKEPPKILLSRLRYWPVIREMLFSDYLQLGLGTGGINEINFL